MAAKALTAIRLTQHVAKNLLFSNLKNNGQKQIIRGSHEEQYFYRKLPVPTPIALKHANFLGAVFWWWITWHVLTDYHELLEHNQADPSKFTDEELGIPPDDAD